MTINIEELDDFVNRIANLLTSHCKTIATAESCSGGLLSHLLTNISGSSQYFMQGIVSYSNESKINLLNVSKTVLESCGAVSESIAKEMADGIRINAGVDIGLSTTGIAGPTGGTKEKPIGLVFIALSTKQGTYVKRFRFHGNRIENKYNTARQALQFLDTYLKENTKD
jgi:nicotinamide-nucleotide amidase